MGKERYTAGQVAEALRAARGDRIAAAKALGCLPRTIDRYIALYPEVRQAWEAMQQGSGGRKRRRKHLDPEEVVAALRAAHGNQAAAARALGCSRSAVGNHVHRFPDARQAYEETRLTNEQVIAALEKADSSQAEAARLLGCSRATVVWRLETDPEVRQAYDRIRAELGLAGEEPARRRGPRFGLAKVTAALRRARGIKARAARLLGCDYDTIRRYIAKFPAVNEAYQEARATILDVAENKLFEAVVAGQWKAVSFVLRTMGKDRGYTRRRQFTGGRVQSQAELEEEMARFRAACKKLDEEGHRRKDRTRNEDRAPL